jgi:hypothetical protein
MILPDGKFFDINQKAIPKNMPPITLVVVNKSVRIIEYNTGS